MAGADTISPRMLIITKLQTNKQTMILVGFIMYKLYRQCKCAPPLLSRGPLPLSPLSI